MAAKAGEVTINKAFCRKDPDHGMGPRMAPTAARAIRGVFGDPTGSVTQPEGALRTGHSQITQWPQRGHITSVPVSSLPQLSQRFGSSIGGVSLFIINTLGGPLLDEPPVEGGKTDEKATWVFLRLSSESNVPFRAIRLHYRHLFPTCNPAPKARPVRPRYCMSPMSLLHPHRSHRHRRARATSVSRLPTFYLTFAESGIRMWCSTTNGTISLADASSTALARPYRF